MYEFVPILYTEAANTLYNHVCMDSKYKETSTIVRHALCDLERLAPGLSLNVESLFRSERENVLEQNLQNLAIAGIVGRYDILGK